MTDVPVRHGFETPYPSYDVLEKWDTPSFDAPTRRVVAHRLGHVPPRRFFTEAEYALLRCVIDTVLPQPERSEEERIPVEAFLDEKLHKNAGDGTRYVDVPPQREAWRGGLAAIDREAQRRFGRLFRDLDRADRETLLARIDGGEIDDDLWQEISPKRFFRQVLMKQAVKIYYAHPAAWNEIGFGGPAAPRGYLRLGPNMRDPWEAREERSPQKVEDLP